MKKKTKSQQLIDGLLKIGFVEDPTDRSKYRAFKKLNDPLWEGKKIFVGPSGALRRGKNASTSFSLTRGRFYNKVMEIGDEKGKVIL